MASSDSQPIEQPAGPPPAQPGGATPAAKDKPAGQPEALEEAPEPIEEVPEPLDEPLPASGADSTSIRRPVMEPGHGQTSATLAALQEPETSGASAAGPKSDSSGKLKTLGEGRHASRSSGGIKALPESRVAGESSGTLKAFADPLHPPPTGESASAVHRALEEMPTIDELDVEKLSDEDLMRLCQEGDEGAFEVLFKRYEGPSLSFIYRMIGDRNRTEALGQEAFLRIFKDAKSYQYPRSFSTWFYTIVRNLCKNELRWRSRHPTVSIEDNVGGSRGRGDSDGVHIGDNLRSQTTDPLELMVSTELTSKLDEALKTLPELERDILILKCFQGLKYREIAEVVGVPVGTVRSRIHGALERLRKSVKDYL